ncbi:NADPH:quinone reductase [soil metagenome]
MHDVSVGDRVWTYLAQAGRPTGTAQEYVVFPRSRVVPLPDGASFEVGASLGVPAMTAHRPLTVEEDWPARLYPGALEGATVLVAGGAGAVGHAAIQLARWAGATVMTTISGPEKGALAAAAGAHHVVNKTDDAAAVIRGITPDGVDLVVEVSPAQNATLNAAVGEQALANTASDVSAAAGAGALAVGAAAGLPLHHFSLADTAKAHDAVQGGVTGKVLINVGE